MLCMGFKETVLKHLSLCVLLLSVLAVPKTEIVSVFLGVAVTTKGLQQIAGHGCKDLIRADCIITILFLSLCSGLTISCRTWKRTNEQSSAKGNLG